MTANNETASERNCGSCGFWNSQAFTVDVYRENSDGWGMCERHSTRFCGSGPERLAEAISFANGVDGEFMTRNAFCCCCWDGVATVHLLDNASLPCPVAESPNQDDAGSFSDD